MNTHVTHSLETAGTWLTAFILSRWALGSAPNLLFLAAGLACISFSLCEIQYKDREHWYMIIGPSKLSSHN